MEKIIEESKQGESLVLENKPENTKKALYQSYGCAMNFSDSEIVALFYQMVVIIPLKF
jgi:tRNA-2-methylthio-N6-dimethylallyladenosine synthase